MYSDSDQIVSQHLELSVNTLNLKTSYDRDAHMDKPV